MTALHLRDGSKNSRVVAVCGIVVIVIGVWSLYRRFFPETLEQVATKGLDCAEAGNAGCILPYLDHTERTQLAVSESKLHDLLEKYFLPATSPSPDRARKVAGANQQVGFYSLEDEFSFRDGRRTALISTAVLHPKGIKLDGFLSGLILAAMYLRHHQPGDRVNHFAFFRGASEDAAILEGLGFNGLVMPQKGFESWAQMREDYRARLLVRGYTP